jgi:hypothetical protein
MVDVTVGYDMVGALYPKNAPTKTNGMETQHHMAAIIKTSKKGTDPELWKKKSMTLKNKNVAKHKPGKMVAVRMVHNCQALPLNALNNLEDTYPAKIPQSM